MNAMTTIVDVVAAAPTIENPIDGIVPDFSVFGAEFNTLWKKLFAGLWAGALLFTIANFLIAFAAASTARSSNHPGKTAEARRDVGQAGMWLGGVAAFGVIVTVILALFS